MVNIQPFKINVPNEVLKDIRQRLQKVRWPYKIANSGWKYGTNLDYMKEIVDYWLNNYDWRKEEKRLNQYPQFKADVNGVGIHFLKIEGKSKNPTPLLMLHGYPWSVATLYKIIPMLTNPVSYGGDPEDSFTVIAPSLCGFCLSDPIINEGFSIVQHAEKYHELMVEGLGYKKYGLEGGDWGGIITLPYGHYYSGDLIGIHINYMAQRMRDERTPKEMNPNIIRGLGLERAPIEPKDPDSLKFWKASEHYWIDEGAYAHVNMTRPQSLSYAMVDSPVGMLAWFIEKFRAWSDWDDNFEELFSKDELITNLMLYWWPKTFSSAIRIYYETHHHPWTVKPGDIVNVPTGIAAFPKDIVPIIKSQAEKYYNVVQFTEYPRGGHFAIHEQAEILANDIKKFFRLLK